jgi:glycosyltransferase involved in cell wall biosynthesis
MIFIVSRGFPTPKYPLNGIFELDQAKSLQHIGCEIVFVVLDFRSIFKLRKFGIFARNVNGLDCFHISFPLGDLENPLFNFIARKITLFGSYFLKKRHSGPKVIHSHFFQISSLALELKNKFKVPFVVTEHSSIINNQKISNRNLLLANRVYANADQVICVSSALSQKIKSHFNISSTVIPNIVSSDIFNVDYSKKLADHNNQFVFVSVGVLSPIKRFDLLIDAFSFCKFSSNVKLQIIGDGELKSNLQERVIELGLQNTIEFLGFRSREQTAEIFKKADSFVLASQSETFGVVFLEALFSGLPVISTMCGGPEDFVNDSNGILVPINDVDSLSTALRCMYENHEKYNSKEISSNALKMFSPDVIAQKISNLYTKLSVN